MRLYTKTKKKGMSISYQMLSPEEKRMVNRLVCFIWSLYVSALIMIIAIGYFIVKAVLSFF